MRSAISALVSFAALAACSQQPPANEAAANDMTSMNVATANDTATAALPTDAQGYLAAAMASDRFAIDSSQAVESKTDNDAVKRYAATVIADRTKTSQGLEDAAQKAGLTLPEATLWADQQKKLDTLGGLTGHDLDAEYARQQLAALQQTLILSTTYANGGDTPALRKAARNTLAVVQRHLAALRGMTGLSS